MLGKHYKIRVMNTQNRAITVTINSNPWKFSSGALSYAGESLLMNAVSVAATNGDEVTSAVDNSTALNLGTDLLVDFTIGTTATSGTGTVALYLDVSTDGGTDYPTSGQGIFIGAYSFDSSTTSTTVTKNFQIG